LLPTPGKSNYHTVHRFGYSEFHFAEDGIFSSMTIFVDPEESVKYIYFKIKNLSGRVRKLSLTGYVEWVLGDLRSKTVTQITTELDPDSGALLAGNAYNSEFGNYISFFDVDDPAKTFTGDRAEFLGRNGTYKNPEAMGKAKLSGRTGAALDACGVLQSILDMTDSEERILVFRLGAGKDQFSALQTIKKCRGSNVAENALARVKKLWIDTLSTVQVKTPDPSIDFLFNGWLNYQTLGSRIWGRTGFYQSGGAFGFRDQLQDSLSLMHNRPDLVKNQILLSASRQFPEGDVQHWWHPPMGRGVRTTCSDDYLWLPYVVSRYVKHTGDTAILDEKIRFIDGRLLNPGEDSYYELPGISDQSGSLYEHCRLSVQHGLRFGAHGLPLMGSGDWNDGMDKVGNEGRGESVWLAFFLYDVLMRFQELAHSRKDLDFSDRCKKESYLLKKNIELNSWDGNWYLRAFFDDGTPLGSSKNTECKIDSIPQSWSVISKGGDLNHSKSAMNAAHSILVSEEMSLIKLFDPPFNQSQPNPGYIRGYLPGVRENGGQYTHAAIWYIIATAALENKQRTYDLMQMINPINHSSTSDKIKKYKIEPYVIAADVYAVENHQGMGGWTWYTGSAGWMYQLLAESFFGLVRIGNRLEINPCIPDSWNTFEIRYRFADTMYLLKFERDGSSSKMSLLLDGIAQDSNDLLLVNDKMDHEVKISLATLKA
jgi:cyclic beta-1,2-glucan synthetase